MTVFEDEALIIMVASRDTVLKTLTEFFGAVGIHTHPPLYDILIRGWMLLTGATGYGLRIPSIAFYIVGLWLLADIAVRRGASRNVALLILALWPAGVMVAIPAHWGALAFLATSAMTWACLRWSQSQQPVDLALLAASAIMLIYTNYYGVLAFALLMATLIPHASARQHRFGLALSGLAVGITTIPLLRPLIHESHAGTAVQPGWPSRLGEAALDLYTLFAGPGIAPWSWPALIIATGVAGLALANFQIRRPTQYLILFLALYVPAAAMSILSTKRIALLAPWLLLAIIELHRRSHNRRLVSASIGLIGAASWMGVLASSPSTYRYAEPWAKVASMVAHDTRPGDLIIASHPSFFFYARQSFGWKEWPDPYMRDIVERSGRTFCTVWRWRDRVSEHDRVVYVRSVLAPHLRIEEDLFMAYMNTCATETTHERFIQDRAFALKNRLMGNQPEWRIEVIGYEIRGDRPPVPPDTDD